MTVTLAVSRAAPAGVRLTAAPAVVTVGLTRTFRARGKQETVALEDLSLEIASGETHGLLGPNGAGKTTLVKILCTVLTPTAGDATVLGWSVLRRPQQIRRRIGIVFGGERGLYPKLTARQNLRYFASLYDMPRPLARTRTDMLLERVGLSRHADLRVETFSRGMKQRLHLARGLIHDPPLVFLDEPTNGLDPAAAREVRQLITELKAAAKTVLVATHDMVEAELLCDHVTLVDRGRLVATETPAALRRLGTSRRAIVTEALDQATCDRLRRIPSVLELSRDGPATEIAVADEAAVPAVLHVLADAGARSVRTALPSLEAVYLQLLGARGLDI
jgi:ABC-2 type transport system ATP-binding protein